MSRLDLDFDRLNLKKIRFRSIGAILFGALLSSIALKLFVRKANLVPAGVSGVATLVQKELLNVFNISIPFGILYFVINFAILAFVYKKLGKKFLMLSLLHIVFTSVIVDFIPNFTVTDDEMLLAVFGGILNGLGLTISLKGGGSSGGTDFIAIYYSTVKNKPMWNKILIFNMIMLIYNGWRYDWTLSFYSIIYQFASTEILSTYHDRYKLSSLRIITKMPNEVSHEIMAVVRHGITRFDGCGMYSNTERAMLYTVVNSFEIKEVVDAVKCTDPKAFIEISTVDRIEGNFRQKPLE